MQRRRGTETAGDMIRSLGLVLLLVAVVGGVIILSSPGPSTTPEVDYRPALAQAREAAPFAVVGPDSLPDGWQVTRVSFDAGEGTSAVWRMSLITDSDEYVGLTQSTGDLDRVVRRELPAFVEDGVSQVAGQEWTRVVETGVRDADVALVSAVDDSVVVLLGSGGYVELEELASRLR